MALAVCSSAGSSEEFENATVSPIIVQVIPPPEADRLTLDAWLGNGDPSAAQVAPLIRKAREGDAISQWQLGVMIDTRQIAGGTLEEAVSLFEASAEHGLSTAVVSLGIMHARGRGTDQDFDAARKAFEQAARMGDASAFYQLGVMHYQGHGAPADYQESMAWMIAAAELGNEWAQRSLQDDFIEIGADYDLAKQRAADILTEFQESSSTRQDDVSQVGSGR